MNDKPIATMEDFIAAVGDWPPGMFDTEFAYVLYRRMSEQVLISLVNGALFEVMGAQEDHTAAGHTVPLAECEDCELPIDGVPPGNYEELKAGTRHRILPSGEIVRYKGDEEQVQ